MKYVFIGLVSGLLLSACATTQTPPNTPLQVAPEKAVSNMPDWFVEPPESTTEAVYVVGTSLSRDLSMSVQKATMDAEGHLANKIAGEVSTMAKDYKRDVGDEYTQSTEVIAYKLAADVKVIGGKVTKKLIVPEGGGYRTYVMIMYPLGSANHMLQNYLAKKSFTGSKAATEAEFERKVSHKRQEPQASVMPVTNTQMAAVDNSGIVIRATRASEDSGPLNLGDGIEEN